MCATSVMRGWVFSSAVVIVLALFLLPPTTHRFTQTVEAAATQCGNPCLVTIPANADAFVPATIKVLVNTRVNWTNLNDRAHTVTTNAGQTENFDKPIAPHSVSATGLHNASVLFDAVGTTTYYCRVHGADTMSGTVEVVAAFDATPPPAWVEMKNNQFRPSILAVNVSAEVVWGNNDTNAQHKLQFENQSIGNDGNVGGDVAPGQTVNYTFTAAGSFRYRCIYHSAANDFENGMVGKIVVGQTTRFPPRVRIETPSEGAEVRGTVNVTGDAEGGLGGVNVTRVEIRFSANESWITATLVPGEDGLGWFYLWNSTTKPDGNVTISARARGQFNLDSETENVTVSVQNGDTVSPAPTKRGLLPGPTLPVMLLTVAASLLLVRRRR